MRQRITLYVLSLLIILFISVHPPTWAVQLNPLGANPGLGCFFTSGAMVGDNIPSLGCLAEIVINLIEVAFIFLGAVAIVYLLVASIKFILSGGNEKAVKSSRDMFMYALIGTAFLILAFFLIRVVSQTFGLPDVITNFTLFQK